jgi:ribosome-binding protein aMBF1 (putative translation factor)
MGRAKKYKSVIIDSIKEQISETELKKTESKMLLALKIKEAMAKKGMSNSDLAEVLVKNNSQITKWLSGTHNFTHDTLIEIGRILNISLINNKEKENLANPQFNLQIKLESRSRLTTPNIVANQITINDITVKALDC